MSTKIKKIAVTIKNILGRLIFFGVLALGASGGWSFIQAAHNAQLLNENFKANGIKVPGYIAGYEWHTCHGRCRPHETGYIPVIMYMTLTGQYYQYRADDYNGMYGAVSEEDKKALEKTDITVTYLPDLPQIARVDKWFTNDINFLYGSGATIMFGCIFIMFFLVHVILRPDIKTENAAPLSPLKRETIILICFLISSFIGTFQTGAFLQWSYTKIFVVYAFSCIVGFVNFWHRLKNPKVQIDKK